MRIETINQRASALRQRAEARAATLPPSALSGLSPDDVERLIHDLRVRQIELELQNEELLRTQVELDELRAHYFDLYNLAPVGYLTLGEKGTILEANQRAAELLGLPRERLVKRQLSRFIHPDDADLYDRHTRQLWQTGEPQSCEVRLAPRRADATAAWAHLELALAQDAQSHATACHAILSSLAERNRAEQAVRESEAKYRLLFETMAQGVVYQSANGEISAANPAAERILGLTLDQMQGRTSADLRWRAVQEDGSEFPGEMHPAMVALHTGQTVNDVIMGVFSPAAEAYRWLSISATPQFQPGAYKPHQVYTTFTDITKQYQAGTALAAREEEQRLILDHLSVGVGLVDHAGAVSYVNPRFTELFGYTRVQIPTLANWWPLAYPEPAYREQVVAEWNRRLAEALGGRGEIRPLEVAITGSDGSEKYVRVTARTIGDLLFVTFIDLTERQAAEEAVRASESRYRDLYENAPVAYFSVGADGRIRRCNRQAAQLTGYPTEQLAGRPVLDLYADTPHGKPKASQMLQRFLAGEPVAAEALQMLRADGRLIWISLSVTVIRDAAGQVVESRSAVLDITEHKRAEEALAESEQRYRLVTENAVDVIWLLDLATQRFTYVSPSVFRLCGYTPDEVLTQPVEMVMTLESYQRVLEGLTLYQRWESPFEPFTPAATIRIDQWRKDGSLVPTAVTTALLRDAAGQATHVVGVSRDITEQLAAEDALRASEERYRMLLMLSPDGISVADQTGRILACNEQFAAMYGFDNSAQAVGSYAQEHTSPEAFAGFYREIAATLERGESVVREIEVEVLRRDVSPFRAVYNVVQVPWPDVPSGVVYLSTVRDITKQTAMTAELERHRIHLEELVAERTHDLQAEIAERERIRQTLAERLAELTNLQELGQLVSLTLSLEEVIGTYLERLVTLADLDMAQVFLLREGRLHLAGACSHLAGPAADSSRCGAENDGIEVGECLCGLAVQAGQTVYAGEIACDPRCTNRHCHAGGLHSLAALPLRSGEIVIGVLVVASTAPAALTGRLTFLETAAHFIVGRLQNALLHQEIRDRAVGLEELVTERTRELQMERDRSQAILDTVGESVVVTDLEGQVLFANPVTAALTGYFRDETVGRPIWRHWSAPALEEAWPAAQEALHSDRAWNGEISGCRKDGAAYTFAVTGTPLQDADAGPGSVGVVWVQRDVTTLKEAARLKDQFVSNVSHELRTPVSIIALGCDNLSTFYDRLDEGQRREILHDIEEQAHVLSSLVSDTLLLSQIDAGRMQTARNRVDLARLVRDEANGLRQRAGQRGQRLSVSAPAAVTVLGNERQLRQVVRNLLDNAIKYTPAGQHISCTCEVRAGGPDPAAAAPSTADAWAVVEIADEGIGIAAPDLPYLFQRFYRVNNEGETAGTGLGLSLARELVQLHGGRITVASTPGQGSTFTVYLPVAGA